MKKRYLALIALVLLIPVCVWAWGILSLSGPGASTAAGANEDFTTYTEVDAASDLTVTSAKVDVSSMAINVESYVYYDKGVNHFAGDFEHLTEIYIDSATAFGAYCYHWMLANTIDDAKGIKDSATEDALAVFWYREPGNYYIRLQEIVDATNQSDSYTCSADTLYYLKIKRTEGSPSYLYCYIYSDASRETLVDTLTLTLTADLDLRYIYSICSYNAATTNPATGYSQNFNLQE
jgi:hypothetical protein